MRLTLEQIEAFVLASELGSFSAAARQMMKSQSTISTAISNLEIALDVELFDRSSKFPQLTEHGSTLLREARAIYQRGLAFERHGDSLADGDPISIPLAIGIPHQQISSVLNTFSQEFPHVDISILNPDRGDATKVVLDDEALMGVAFSLPNYPRELDFRQLGKLYMTHVVHKDHPLAAFDSVDFDDLRGYRHLAYSSHHEALPTSEYLQSVHTWSADSYMALIALALEGIGWATIPRQLILDEIHSGELIELQLAAYPFTDWAVSVDLIWRRNRRFGSVEEWLRRKLCNHKVHEVGRDGQDSVRL